MNMTLLIDMSCLLLEEATKNENVQKNNEAKREEQKKTRRMSILLFCRERHKQ
jgi:hypothetical protein